MLGVQGHNNDLTGETFSKLVLTNFTKGSLTGICIMIYGNTEGGELKPAQAGRAGGGWEVFRGQCLRSALQGHGDSLR